MPATINSAGYTEAAASATLPRRTGMVLAFVALGFAAMVLVFILADRLPQLTPTEIVLSLLLAIPVGIVSVIGAMQGLQKVMALRKELVWWHWLWLLIAISATVFRFARDATQVTSAPLDAWALLRLGPEGIVVLALIIRLALRRPNWLPDLFTGLTKWMAIFALVCVTTTLWSIYASWTFYKSVEFLFDVSLLAAVLASIDSVRSYSTLLDWTWLLYGLELLSAWVGSLIWPGEAWVDGRLEGVFPIVPFNSVGETGAILALIAMCRLLTISKDKPQRAWYGVLMAFGLISLIVSQTRNTIAGLLLAIIMVLFYMRRFVTTAILSVTSALALGMSSLGPTIWKYLERDQNEAELVSLTGRMDWWKFAWHQFLLHPLTGLGAYAGGKFGVLAKLHLNNGAIHSDYMEVIVGTGVWGLPPLLIALGGTWWYLIRGARNRSLPANERQWAIECIGVMAILTVHSIFNVELTWHAPLLFFAIIGYAEMMRRKLKGSAS